MIIETGTLNAASITAETLRNNALDWLMSTAETRLSHAVREGSGRFEIDVWNRTQKLALPAVREHYESRGFRVRRRRIPLRWVVDGLVIEVKDARR